MWASIMAAHSGGESKEEIICTKWVGSVVGKGRVVFVGFMVWGSIDNCNELSLR